MKFAQTLHNLREKPDHVKGHIAFWTSLVITGFIFVIWASSLTVTSGPSSFTYKNEFANSGDTVKKTAKEITESSLGASAADAWSSIKDVASNVFEVTGLGGSGSYKAPQDAVVVTPGKVR